MDHGVVLQGVDPPDVFADSAAEIEALGYESLLLTDSSLHSYDPFVYLGLAATRTNRITLGTAVTNPQSRHPAVTAVSIATVAALAPDRTVLGIGAGDRPLLALGHRPAKLALLRSSIATIRSLLDGDTRTEETAWYRVDQGHIRVPVGRIPVFVSASGPKTLALAGEIADGVIVLAGLFPAAIEYALEHIDAGARRAGRRRPHVTVFAYGAVNDEDEDQALAAGASIAAWFPQTAPHYCEMAGLDPDILASVRAAYAGGEFQEAGSAARLLPGDFVRKMSLAGGSDLARRHISSLIDTGVDSVHVFPLGEDRMATVRRFAAAFDDVTGR